jgi:TfuA protein
MTDIAIFLGPSLDLTTARSVLSATYLPPIKRGDLSALGKEFRTVGIVDGEFFQNLAVSPKEVLPLLDRGVKVYGSSSMGALRAVETYPFGMIGVGAIFEWYRDGVIDADDEVALTYEPITYRHSSEPLVNIRFALKAAVEEKLIAAFKADEIIHTLKKVYFPYRSYQLVCQLCPELKDFLTGRPPDQKRHDALLLLHTIANSRRLVLFHAPCSKSFSTPQLVEEPRLCDSPVPLDGPDRDS